VRGLLRLSRATCETCGGIWFDWFDGELTSLARRARAVGPQARPPDEARVRERTCPRCLDPLEADTVHDIQVLRCGSCAGVFVDRAAAESLAHIRAATSPEENKADPLARLAAWLKDLMFGNAGGPR
jgi:Zn-finger nucleic acid-binding protein